MLEESSSFRLEKRRFRLSPQDWAQESRHLQGDQQKEQEPSETTLPASHVLENLAEKTPPEAETDKPHQKVEINEKEQRTAAHRKQPADR